MKEMTMKKGLLYTVTNIVLIISFFGGLSARGIVSKSLPRSNSKGRDYKNKIACQPATSVSREYIVVLKEGVAKSGRDSREKGRDIGDVGADLTRIFGGEVLLTWSRVLQGFLIRMPESAAAKMAAHPLVKSLELDDLLVTPSVTPVACYDDYTNSYSYFNQPSGNPGSPQFIDCWNPQTFCVDNWGLDRIDQHQLPRNYQYNFSSKGRGVHIYILDMGIANHQEFGNGLPGGTRMGNGINFVAKKNGVIDPSDTFDCNGHGTHVAGIAAGLRYGVAKEATIHPVRVVPCQQHEERSSVVLQGIEWISANAIKPAVVNFSSNLFVNPDYQSNDRLPAMELAFQNLISRDGITVVNSAGNQNAYVGDYSPTRLRDVIVVAGSDSNDQRMGFDPMSGPCLNLSGEHVECGSSNYGEFVDLYAPASDILSASNQGPSGVCRLTGTSMAAPHVTGVVAAFLSLNPAATPAQVATAIINRSTPGVIHGNFGYGTPNRLLYNGF
jgi:subtilisin family serine protease